MSSSPTQKGSRGLLATVVAFFFPVKLDAGRLSWSMELLHDYPLVYVKRSLVMGILWGVLAKLCGLSGIEWLQQLLWVPMGTHAIMLGIALGVWHDSRA